MNNSGGNTSNEDTYSDERVFESDIDLIDKSFDSKTGGDNSIRFAKGVFITERATITKTGDENSDEADYTGSNAATLARERATLDVNSSPIDTTGNHAHAIFSHGDGTVINAMNSRITTNGSNSSGLMATNNGLIVAVDLDLRTNGASSPLLRIGRGGGEIRVYGGRYSSLV